MEVTTIEDLPEEVFEVIAQFLSKEDLAVCFDVCRKWRRILNCNRIWKRCCIYPEKYFKLHSEYLLQHSSYYNDSTQEFCTWRQYFELQKGLWKNWNEGRFVIEKLYISPSHISNLYEFVDDYKNYWLFDGSDGITLWNITKTPVIHSKVNQTDHFSIWPIEDKILTFRSNYVKVFQFKNPGYNMKLQYRFKFNMSDILPEDEVVPEDDYTSGLRYILFNHYFVGYSENITNIHNAFMHIWELNEGKKIATQSVYQQSFVDFIQTSTGTDITKDFTGGLLLFAGDSNRFLVNLIDDRFKLCQISLFNVEKMRFMNVVARVESRTAWCFMQGDVIVIYHILGDDNSQVSVYNVSGQFLAKLDFPANYNPVFNDEFWFTGTKVILKVKKKIHVLTITDSVKVSTNYFKLDKEKYILCYFDPKFLVLFNRGIPHSFTSSASVSIFDIESGVRLWKLGKLSSISRYRSLLINTKYPGKIIVHFKGDKEMSILNFLNIYDE